MNNRRFYKVLLLIGMGALSLYSGYHVLLASQTTTKFISVTLYNSYSWALAWSSGNNFLTSGGMLWGSGISPLISISANASSQYTLTGDYIWVLTGEGSGWYLHMYTLSVSWWDGLKSYQTFFEKWYEPLESNVLSYMLDTTVPTIPSRIALPDNTIVPLDTVVTLQRSASHDVGIGLAWYRVFVSLHPSFIGAMIRDTSATSLQFLPGALPSGTLYRYVEAIDYLWNKSNSPPGFFHYDAWTIVIPWGWTWSIIGGYGGWVDTRGEEYRDRCPDWDNSPSYYDNTCVAYTTWSGSVHTWSLSWWIITPKPDMPPIWSVSTWDIWDRDPIVVTSSNWVSKTIVKSYYYAQSQSPIGMILPTSYYRTPNKVHMSSPWLYYWLLQRYYAQDYVPPIGYSTIYLSWILILTIFLQEIIKRVLKNLTSQII